MGRIFVFIGYAIPSAFILLSIYMAWSSYSFYANSRAVEATITAVDTRTEWRTRRVTHSEYRGGERVESSTTESYQVTVHALQLDVETGLGSVRPGAIEVEDRDVHVGMVLAVRYDREDPDDVRLDTGTTGIWAGPLFLGVVFGLIPLALFIFISRKFG